MSWRKTLAHLNRGGSWVTRPKHPLKPVEQPIRLGDTPGYAMPEMTPGALGLGERPKRHRAYTPEEGPQDGKVPGTAGFELQQARELLAESRAFAPHCDARILHAPGDCWACDLYPDWQALRVKWGIAFTGHKPEVVRHQVDKRDIPVVIRRELPCPADYNRPPDSSSDHRQWGPNRAQGERP